jgi:hypothetical protein
MVIVCPSKIGLLLLWSVGLAKAFIESSQQQKGIAVA